MSMVSKQKVENRVEELEEDMTDEKEIKAITEPPMGDPEEWERYKKGEYDDRDLIVINYEVVEGCGNCGEIKPEGEPCPECGTGE